MLAQITIGRLRFGSGLILITYIASHLANHALGLISLDTAERGLAFAILVWQSKLGTFVLYGAATTHISLALRTIYMRRTLRLPPTEWLRIALGLWLPVLLIGHAVTARLEHEVLGSASTYTRIVAGIWNSGGEWRQLGILAPGWLHGCLGLNFALSHRGWYRRARPVLFAFVLLVPVLSALGFVSMGRDIQRQELAKGATAPSQDGYSYNPSDVEQNPRLATLNRWRSGLLWGYFGFIGLAFGAREIRNFVERKRDRLVVLSYPARTVKIPQGWTVLEASRAFHLPHAAMCAGAARCSTCRVRVLSGQEYAPPPDEDERVTLKRIGAAIDVRLACRLKPQQDMSVVPLVETDAPQFRQAQRRIDGDSVIVILVADVINRDKLAREHLAQDLLFVLTRISEATVSAVEVTGGAISHIGHDSVCAIFGYETGVGEAARAACEAATILDQSLRRLDRQVGSLWECRPDVRISIHLGPATLAEGGRPDTPEILIVGDAYDEIQSLRQACRVRGARFAISHSVLAEVGVTAANDPIHLQVSRRRFGVIFADDAASAGIVHVKGRHTRLFSAAFKRA